MLYIDHSHSSCLIIFIKVTSTMSMSKIERKEESYEDFAYRFQLAEGLPMDDRGIIFIGNTRAGKSTLALSMTGAAMKVVYDSGNMTYVNPTDKKL